VNSYLVERYLPGMSEAELRRGIDRAQAACVELRSAGSYIQYLGSTFLPLEEACFCRFDADGEETIAEANRRADLSFARITAGVTILPRTSLVALPEAGPDVPRVTLEPDTPSGG
jgi:uncharacterized protein DUF4242